MIDVCFQVAILLSCLLYPTLLFDLIYLCIDYRRVDIVDGVRFLFIPIFILVFSDRLSQYNLLTKTIIIITPHLLIGYLVGILYFAIRVIIDFKSKKRGDENV